MINFETLKMQREEISNRIAESIRANDKDAMASAFGELDSYVSGIVQMESAGILANASDTNILASRGARQLTQAEKKYYEYFIDQVRAEAKTIGGIDNAMPETIIDTVMDDVQSQSPLLGYIDFKNTTALTKWIINKEGIQTAAWGPLNSEFTKELEGSIGVIDTTLCKLTAFMYISKDMLALGPVWVDRYVRGMLTEAILVSLETAVVSGDGKDCPIGMIRDVSDNVVVTGGRYPEKPSIAITQLDTVTFGTILAMLTKTPTGRTRTVGDILMIVNPTDYFSKVMPATTLLLPDGTYKNNVLPYGRTSVVQSVGVPEGKMVIGIAKRYFAGAGLSKNVKMEYSDEYKFLEDWRTYTARFYGTGLPMDNNSFIVCDISGLESTAPVIIAKDYNETRLASLSLGSLELTPKFDKNTLYYTAETTSATNTVTATAKDTEATVTIDNGGTTVQSGSAATWKTGLNNLRVKVSTGGDDRVYTISVVKK